LRGFQDRSFHRFHEDLLVDTLFFRDLIDNRAETVNNRKSHAHLLRRDSRELPRPAVRWGFRPRARGSPLFQSNNRRALSISLNSRFSIPLSVWKTMVSPPSSSPDKTPVCTCCPSTGSRSFSFAFCPAKR